MEMPPVGVHLVVGHRLVRIDVVHDLIGQHLQLFRAEGGGEPGQQPFTLLDSGRVEPAVIHLPQRPLHHRHLLGVDLPGPLGGGQ